MSRSRIVRDSRNGFTLAELLVACVLITVVMTAVYTSFGSSIRQWRLGEENMAQYQDARMAAAVLRKDLMSLVPGSWHLFEGDDSSYLFLAYVVNRPLNPKNGTQPRVLQVTYALRRNPDNATRTLIRKERPVLGPLPLKLPGRDEPVDPGRLKLGSERSFELADKLRGVRIEYVWTVLPEQPQPGEEDVPPEPAELVVRDAPPEDWQMPQAIRAYLTVQDTAAEKGETTLPLHIVYRNSPPTLHRKDVE